METKMTDFKHMNESEIYNLMTTFVSEFKLHPLKVTEVDGTERQVTIQYDTISINDENGNRVKFDYNKDRDVYERRKADTESTEPEESDKITTDMIKDEPITSESSEPVHQPSASEEINQSIVEQTEAIANESSEDNTEDANEAGSKA